LSRPLFRNADFVLQDPEDIKSTFNAGGAGCFAKPAEYCQIIATLLNDGVHPGTGNRILKKETVDEMFTNQACNRPYPRTAQGSRSNFQ
jgi:hypothetical protein